MTMFHLLRIRTSIDIFKNEKCKVTFVLEYIWCKFLKKFFHNFELLPFFDILDIANAISRKV